MPGCFDMFKTYVVSSHISDIFITGFLSSGRRKSTVKSDCKSLSLRRIRSWYDQGQGNQVSSDLPGLFCMPLHYILIIIVFSSAKSYLLLGARSDWITGILNASLLSRINKYNWKQSSKHVTEQGKSRFDLYQHPVMQCKK